MKAAPVILSIILGVWRPEDLTRSVRYLDADGLTRMEIDCKLWVMLSPHESTHDAQEAVENCRLVPQAGFELN